MVVIYFCSVFIKKALWSNLRPCSWDFWPLGWFPSLSPFIYWLTIKSLPTLLPSPSGNFLHAQYLMSGVSSVRGPHGPWSLHLPKQHPWGTMNIGLLPSIVSYHPGIHMSLTYTYVTRGGGANNRRCRVTPASPPPKKHISGKPAHHRITSFQVHRLS